MKIKSPGRVVCRRLFQSELIVLSKTHLCREIPFPQSEFYEIRKFDFSGMRDYFLLCPSTFMYANGENSFSDVVLIPPEHIIKRKRKY